MKLVWVDAFTDKAFSGNPAAVVLVEASPDEGWMRDVAREMNLSETAFVSKNPDGGFDLRWFTPVVEVDLCGHATLASAHVLWEEGEVAQGSAISFHTRSGVLGASTSADGWIELDFPAVPAAEGEVPAEVVEAAGVTPVAMGRGEVGGGYSGYLLELSTEEEVRGLAPDVARLAELPGGYLTVTARSSSPRYDFVSRFFAPSAGIDEDPVTGSAHCTLGPWWAGRLGKDELVGYQASERGGVVRVRLSGDRVVLGGQAITVFRGSLL